MNVGHFQEMAGRFASGRVRTTRRRLLSGVLLVVIVGVGASGCDWTLFGYGAANTRNSPDTGISTSNVATLAKSWSHAFATGNTGQIVDSVTEADNVVYVTSDIAVPGDYGAGTLAAFSATACAQTPASCTPLWEAPTDWDNAAMLGTPIVANGEVYVSNRNWFGAFSTDYSGCTTKVAGVPLCAPLAIYDNSGGGGAGGSPVVVNNLLYAPGTGYVFSANGTGCTTKPGYTWLGALIPVCEPLWTNVASTGSSFTYGGTPTVATASAGSYNGDPILYLAAPTSGGSIKVFAYDANGNNSCGVYYVKICEPLWTDSASGAFPVEAGAVSVANGYAYVGGNNPAGQGTLFAFDQNGVTGCGSGTCAPEFQTSGGPTAPTPINLAVSGSTVYGTGGGNLLAFGGTGCGQASCTGTLWNSGEICADGGATTSTVGDTGAPNVSNGVVYVGITCGPPYGLGTGGGVAAYNTSGTRLWSAASPDGGTVYNAPIVANGVLYFGTVNGSVYAYAPS